MEQKVQIKIRIPFLKLIFIFLLLYIDRETFPFSI